MRLYSPAVFTLASSPRPYYACIIPPSITMTHRRALPPPPFPFQPASHHHAFVLSKNGIRPFRCRAPGGHCLHLCLPPPQPSCFCPRCVRRPSFHATPLRVKRQASMHASKNEYSPVLSSSPFSLLLHHTQGLCHELQETSSRRPLRRRRGWSPRQ